MATGANRGYNANGASICSSSSCLIGASAEGAGGGVDESLADKGCGGGGDGWTDLAGNTVASEYDPHNRRLAEPHRRYFKHGHHSEPYPDKEYAFDDLDRVTNTRFRFS